MPLACVISQLSEKTVVMANKLKQNITPVEVSAAMNFDATDMHWQYQSGASSMAAKQAEGWLGCGIC